MQMSVWTPHKPILYLKYGEYCSVHCKQQQFAYTALVQFLFQFQWPAHRIGIYSNPLINCLIQNTFKMIFVFEDKFPVIL